MDGLIGRLHRGVGFGSLTLGLMFVAAWAKSAIDGDVIPALENGERDAIPVSGFIQIFRYGYAASETDRLVPQISYSVKGLFSEASICIAPNEVNPGWLDTGLEGSDEQALINRDRVVLKSAELLPPGADRAVQVLESGDDNWVDGLNTNIVQTRATQAAVPALSAPMTLVGLTDIDASTLNSQSNIEDVESAYSTTLADQWQCCGIRYEKYNDDDGTWSSLWLIPHWIVCTSFLGLSAVLLIGPWKKGRQPAVPGASVSPSEATATPNSVSTLFQTQTGRVGLVTLSSALLLAGAWVRSLGVTDVTRLIVGPQTRVLLISGAEGLVVKKEMLDTEGMESGHTTRTGVAHQPMRFRPESPSVSGVGVDFDFNIPSPTQSADEAIDALPVSTATIVPVVAPTNMDWIGQSIDWCGFHVSLGPDQTTIMIPYAFFVVPLTLLSAVLLMSRRFVVVPFRTR